MVTIFLSNKSLSTGIFPSKLKQSVIKPIIKNFHSDPNELLNYRPISNISFLSKLLEKAVLVQLNNFLVDNKLYCNSQSGYRQFHSCETLNICMFNNIFKEIDNGKIVLVLLLDMSAAFDTIDHELLLKTLKNSYGIDKLVLNWLSSYLNYRSFSVNINDSFSDPNSMLYGVPQGSILGPILFILYTKHLQHIAHNFNLNIQLYADDTQLYISFNPDDQYLCTMLCNKVAECINEMKEWFSTNYLKLNEDKTKLVLFSKPSVFKKFKLSQNCFTIATKRGEIKQNDWTSISEVKSLGIRLDPQLTIHKHIMYVKQYCIRQLKSWKHIANFLNEDVKLLLVKQIIFSKIDYCNSLFVNLPKSLLRHLDCVINSALRFVYNVRYSQHITPYYIKAHILPLKFRIDYKICLTVFNCLNDIAPQYLQMLLSWNAPLSPINCNTNVNPRKTKDPFLLVIPSDFGKKTRYHSRCFSQYAPRCWNKLPYDIRSCKLKSVFKTKLKTFFFEQFLSES